MNPLKPASRPLVRFAVFLALVVLAGALFAASLAASSAQPARRIADPVADTLNPGRAPQVAARHEPPEETVRRAWERARDAGAYRFVTDLTQSVYPAARLSNAGSTPERSQVHIEGAADLPGETLQLELWQGGGSVLDNASGIQLRVEKGVAYTRRLAGAPGSNAKPAGTWEETPDISANFAPGGDALAFLAGIKNVAEVGWSATAAGNGAAPAYRRYGFEIDGPALASYMRDRMEEQLRDRGKLPVGMSVETPALYRDALGKGEVWINEDGLPLRLTVHLALPAERDGSHVEGDVRTDFSGYPPVPAAPAITENPVAWAGTALGVAGRASDLARTRAENGWTLLAITCGAAAVAGLVVVRRRRVVYAAVVIAVILSMVVTPLLQSERAAAFGQEQAASQAQQEAQRKAQVEARRLAAEMAGPAFDPHSSPLARTAQPAPAQQAAPFTQAAAPTLIEDPPLEPGCSDQDKNDRDGDGLNNYEECKRGMGVTSDPDYDDDDLADGIEVYQLGTEPTIADTDGDWITDTLEVTGFPYGDNTWYLNPLELDTERDGLPDGLECPALLAAGPYDIAACDTDHDQTPDPWDIDSDNDLVPDSQDAAPRSWMDRDGLHPTANEDGSVTPFTAPSVPPGAVDPRFAFSLDGLQTAQPWPVLVDLQLRPLKAQHLNYALSVLDWPSTIIDGQIQHVRSSTFADLPESRLESTDAAAHGDMQLIPMLEVEMNGSAVPLRLTTASATVQVGEAALASTITLQKATESTTLIQIAHEGATPAVNIYPGACENKGAVVPHDAGHATVFVGRLVDLADGEHVIEVSDGSTSACAAIPNIVNGPYTDQMVDLSALKPYGISVQELGNGSSTLVMYVPLNLVTDDTGGGRTAFAAHMLYYPAATAIGPQYVRFVWAVQAITDRCNTDTFYEDLDDYRAGTGDKDAKQEDYDKAYRAHCAELANRLDDTPVVVQTYDESWYLTGMSVREDHGMHVAAAYENPATHDQYTAPEDDIWNLSLGLGGSFLTQRDCEKPNGAPPVTYDAGNAGSYDPMNAKCSADGLLDLAAGKTDPADGSKVVANSTISERFDALTDQSFHFAHPDLSENVDSFGIPLDSLKVHTEKYAYQDELVQVATKQTAPILAVLKEKYAPGTAVPAFTPTILYAREERFRNAGLDAGTYDPALRLLTIPVTGSEQFLTALSWQTFQYNASQDPLTQAVIGWESIPLADKWEDLQEQFETYFTALYHPVTEEELQANAGRVKIAMSYYLALTQGLVNMADPCPGLDCKVKPSGNSSNDIAKGLAAAVKGVANVLRVCIEEMQAWTARNGSAITSLKLLADIGAQTGPLSVIGFSSFGSRVAFGVTVVAAGVVVAAGLVCLALMLKSAAENGNTAVIIADVLQATGIILTGFGVITAMGRWIRAAAKSGWATVWKGTLDLVNNVKKAWELSKCLTTVIAIAMNFLVFMMQWGSGLAVGSLQWDNALAGAIAASLGAILMWVFFNALGAIGTFVQACIALIDMLVGFICNLTGAYEKAPMAAKWFCGGITGFVNNLIKLRIYSGNLMVDMQAKDLVQFKGWNYSLVHPEKGFVTGNAVNISVDITDTITRAVFPYDSLWALTYFWQWNDANVKKSDFRYGWSSNEWASVDADYESKASLWQPGTADHSYTYVQSANSTQSFPLGNSPGIRSLDAYLIQGYAVPEQECWGLWPLGTCEVHANRDSNAFDIGSSISFAVLPPTLDGFLTLAAKGAGYAQNWGGIRFPVLYDADNDGLPYSSDGDDHVADRDGDGLLDAYEVNIHSNPASADSDGDGLNDRQEVLAGTNPNLQDTDGDGLKDAEEVGHQDLLDADHDGNRAEWLGGWRFVYALDKTTGAPSTAWVWPDPLSVDADSDTLSDGQERVYGYNPGVKSSLNILDLESQLNEQEAGGLVESDTMVAPGQTLYYTATVTNNLLSRQAQGLLWTQTDSDISAGNVPAQPFVLREQEQTETHGTLSVSTDAAGGVHEVTQVAGATITDWASKAGGMVLWLPFNNPISPFGDGSGSLPPHDGRCFKEWDVPSTGCTLDAGGYYGNALKLDGHSYLHSAAEVPQLGASVALWFNTTSLEFHDLFSTQFPDRGAPLYIYLQNGNVNSVLGSSTYPSDAIVAWPNTSVNYADGQWHHVVVTYGKATPTDSADVHRLYVDGELMAAGTATQLYYPASNGFNLGGLASFGTHYSGWLPGMIDDVRVYDRRLSQLEVANLYRKVVFAMDFNLTNPWQDTSNHGATVSCVSGYCPTVNSGAASFTGASFLTASGSIPGLNEGRLTLSAWIQPRNRIGGDPRDTWYQGIVGYHSQRGDATAYPTLERHGLKLRFGFSTGTAWKGVETSSNVLILGAWNHVAATYSKDDGFARIYVNGVERASSLVGSFNSIASPSSFDIGRTTDKSVLKVTHVDVLNTADDSRSCPEYYPPNDNLCIALNGVEWFHEAVGCYSGDWNYDNTYTINGTGSASLVMWENDGGDNCGTACDDNDDCGGMTPNVFSWTTAGTGAIDAPYSVNGGNGVFKLNFSNASIPFYGGMDDVLIYNRALTGAEVADLYQPLSVALHLPLDEPPGAAVFQQAGESHVEARCVSCVAGVAGRIDRAAAFDGASSYLAMRNAPVNQLAQGVTVAAWARPETVVPAVQRIVSSARTHSANGWGFGLRDSSLIFTTYGVKDYLQRDSGVSLTLQPGRWYHLAAVFDDTYAVTFYVDGVYAGRVPTTGPGPQNLVPDTDDEMLIGATTEGASLSQLFKGLIDDVQVYGKAFTADQVKGLYDQAPVMHMRLDESQGATRFMDNARYNVSAGCPAQAACPQAGEAVRGKVGLSAHFDGQDDVLLLDDAAATLYVPRFTIGGWIRPLSVKPSVQPVLAKYLAGGEAAYILRLQAGTLIPEFLRGCSPYNSVAGPVALVQNQWNQVLGTYDGAKMRLYVNGLKVAEASSGAVSCTGASARPLSIGGDDQAATARLAGDLDELIVYNRALADAEVADLYGYQLSWTEDREPTSITVDRDNPTAEVMVSGIPYFPNAPVIVPIGGDDATSEVASAQLCVDSSCGSSAPTCEDPLSSTAWCPTFTPPAEGVFYLSASVTDRVGHTATSAAAEVRVDDTPPEVSVGGSEGQPLTAVRGGDGNWTVHVTGAVQDPALANTTTPGIGVPADGVHVTLYNAAGGLAGAAAQPATVTGSTWAVDYVLSDGQPSGCYEIKVEAVDALAAQYPDEAAHHSSSDTGSAGINTAPPAVQIDRSMLAAGQSLTMTLAGAVSSNYVPVGLSWTTGAGGEQAALSLECNGPGADDKKYTAYRPGSSLGAGQSYTWQGQVHRQATCTLTLTAAEGSPGIVSGSATVCGTEVAPWADNQAASYTVSFTASSDNCAPDQCSGQLLSRNVEKVEVAFKSQMPGSQFVNEAPLTGELFHLPLDDTLGMEGNLAARDASGAGLSATCSGTTCPSPGHLGRVGRAMQFDGVDDYLSTGVNQGLALTSGRFTEMAWINSESTDDGYHGIMGYQPPGFPITQRYPGMWVYQKTAIHAGFGDGVNWNSFTSKPGVLHDGWNHVATTFDGVSYRLYVDGKLIPVQASLSGRVPYVKAVQLEVGRAESKYPFKGSIDDVRVYGRALSQDEIQTIYSGSAPLLHLPLESALAINGTVQPDASVWGNNGTLYTGATDTANKSTTGQVGTNGLKFDGVDDYVSVPADADLALTRGHFTEAAWINSESTDDGFHGIVGYQPPGLPSAQRYPSMWVYQQTAIHAGFGDGVNWNYFTAPNALHAGWNHVATTYDGVAYKLYVDGMLVFTENGFSGRKPYVDTKELEVGRADSRYLFKGSIDDVRLYGRALPAAEVRELYLAGWREAALLEGGGTQSARWSLDVPTGLEGTYRVDLRGTDAAGFSGIAPVWNTADLSSPVWQGEADTTGPRMTFCRSDLGGGLYRWLTIAEDYNLVESGFSTLCPISARTYFRSPWFVTGAPASTQKLYGLVADCSVNNYGTGSSASACDSTNNCTTVSLSNPPDCTIPAAMAQDAIAARANAVAAALKDASATADAAGQPHKPVIAFASDVLTTTHFHAPQAIVITGTVSGVPGFSSVEVSVDGRTSPAFLSDPAPQWPFTRTWSTTYIVPAGPLPDGITVSAAATATLTSPRTVTTEQPLTLDVVPPAAVELSLAADGKPLETGATVRTTAPVLDLTWTGSQDGSGLAGYTTRWTASSATATTVTTRAFQPTATRSDSLSGGEAQALTVEVGSRDRYGNERWQHAGPVYLDTPLTPDYSPLDAYEWQDSGCALMGADRRLYRNGLADAPQQLFATWDNKALRLAWSGASWHVGDGDLFVYLDTGPGGTTELYMPVELPAIGAEVALPATMQADTLIWMQTTEKGTLLRWDADAADGGAWTGATPLAPEQFHFRGLGAQLDMYLPFDLLGLTTGSSLGLIGLGVQEPAEGEAMLLWATLPPFNPVNSPDISRLIGLVTGSVKFELLREYRWPALGDGVCPNGTESSPPSDREGDTDLQLSLTSDPRGSVFSRENSLHWITNPDDVMTSTEAIPGWGLLKPDNPPVADGQLLSYKLEFHNRGADTQVGAYLELRGRGQIRVSTARVDLGDIPPGGTGIASFEAVVDRSKHVLPAAAVVAVLYDTSHGSEGPPLDWIASLHRVDAGAPETPELTLPSLIGPRGGLLTGTATDESGVASVTLDVQWPGGSRLITCPLIRPADGDWACDWDAGAPLPHDTPLTVRIQVTDIHGATSDWSSPRTVRIDAEPPTMVMRPLAGTGGGDAPVVRRTLALYGTAVDAGGVTAVTVCLAGVPGAGDETCARANLQPEGGWSYHGPALGALDSVTRTVSIWATDALGNRSSEPRSLQVRIDNVAPVLTVNQEVEDVVLGRAQTALTGAATDGGSVTKVSARVRPPTREEFRAAIQRNGDTWRYDFIAEEVGRYEVWVEAEDEAGNVASAGPFTVDVTCTGAAPVVTEVTTEPLAGEPGWLALFMRLSNSGSDLLPAGMPLMIYGRGPVSRTLTTTPALAPGETVDLRFDWRPDTEGDWEVVVAPNNGRQTLGDSVLCRPPAEARFNIRVADVPLHSAWNLISSPVQPDTPDVRVVERPIAGTYAAILGYDRNLQGHGPAATGLPALAAVEAGRGYWVRETLDPGPPDEKEPWQVALVAGLRLAGQLVPVDQPVPLAAGWNLAGYLPASSLPVTEALASIDGAYAAVLAFDGTAASYYPDLADGYNTLAELAPRAGYWISATQAISVQYPLTTPVITRTARLSNTLTPGDRLDLVRAAERAAGVVPTYAWTNLYGELYLPDGSPAPISTTVTALSNGVPCGATIVTEPGKFGLLACYGDDVTTGASDGAAVGSALTLLVNSETTAMRPRSFNGKPLPRKKTVTWTGLGDRWEVLAGRAPVDLAIAKRASPVWVQPGEAITYTITYRNNGSALAQQVVIVDHLAPEIVEPAFTFTGALVARREGAAAFEWDVADLPPGAGGTITVMGKVAPATPLETTIINAAAISTPGDAWPDDNQAEATIVVSLQPPGNTLWLPLIFLQ